MLRAATHETERGDNDFCLTRSHYTDNDPTTSTERAATAGNPHHIITKSSALYPPHRHEGGRRAS